MNSLLLGANSFIIHLNNNNDEIKIKNNRFIKNVETCDVKHKKKEGFSIFESNTNKDLVNIRIL